MIEVIGHKGAGAILPENTLSGFKKAVELGCNAVEMDVRLTSDKKLVLMHDETLERTTNGNGLVSDHTLKELKKLDAGKNERIPSLAEVLELLKPSNLRIQIELKGENTENYAPELVKEFNLVERITFTSFFHMRVKYTKAKLPASKAGILIKCSPVNPTNMLNSTGADFLHVSYNKIDERLVKEVHTAGKKIISLGSLEDIPIFNRLIALGVDAVGSNRPDILINHLKALPFSKKNGETFY